jgi:hypothetical protein
MNSVTFVSKVRSAAAHGVQVPPEFSDDNVMSIIVR